VAEIEAGRLPKDNNMLVHAPHCAGMVLAEQWDRPYSREAAAFPAAWVRQSKFWPTTSRVDNVWGDRNLITKLQDEPMVATA
jgi:glycine dehydrogenase